MAGMSHRSDHLVITTVKITCWPYNLTILHLRYPGRSGQESQTYFI